VVRSVASLLESPVAGGAPALHITVGPPPSARVRGELRPLGDYPPFDPETIRTMVYRILTTEQQKRLELDRQLDLSYGVPGLARFRINVFLQRESFAAVFRVIPDTLKTLEELGLPEGLYELTKLPRGL